ncbi:MAG: hypothetical protein HAW62_05155 [Endozoicomonadaceae bacterium]|nr:hypothetical protein [Endozoicomonadaceae bacterium]
MARKMPKKARLGFDGVDVDFLGSRDEVPEERTVESRRRLREMLNAQIQEFIDNGGEIKTLKEHTPAELEQKLTKNTYNGKPL